MKGRAALPAMFALAVLAFVQPARAHEVRPAYLELRELGANTWDVLWKVPARGDMYRLRLDVRMPAGTRRVGQASAAFMGEAYYERWRLETPDGLDGETIHIDGLSATKIDVLVRVQRAGGVTQTVRVTPDAPSFTVEAEPSVLEVATTYLELGVEHILLGIDHLLFVLALVLIVAGRRRLITTVTAFTLAHSITLGLAALGYVHVPIAPVEACIALSIVFVAVEIVHARQGREGLAARSPWVVAFVFGLLHGLGFASALSEIGLPQGAIPAALLTFNVGVEIGQLVFIGVVLGLAAIARRLPVRYPKWSWRVAPYAIGGVAMFWVIERTAAWW